MASTGRWSADSCGSHGSGDGMGAGCGMWVRVGRSAPIPLPSARRGCSDLLMVEDLFGESDIAFRPFGSGVIGQDGFAETGRFGQAYAARDDGPEDLVPEELAEVGGHLPGEVGPVVIHGEEDAFDGEGVLEASRIRSMVSMSSDTPSRAKNSHWMGTRTESAAMSALRVSRSRAGGQSIRMKW